MAAKVIANPVAVLGFRTSEFTRGLQRATKSFKSFASSFSSGLASIASKAAAFTGVGAAIAGVVGGISFTSMISQQAELIDSVGKLSDRLGISTESLTGLQYAASLAGVESEQLSTGLTKLQKTMADAVGGGKESSAAFRELGLSASELINLPTDQALGQIADKLMMVSNPAQRSALAMQIFGKSGAQLLPLLSSGSVGIAAMAAEAERLGLSFTRLDAAKVEAANDAMSRVGFIIQGVGRSLAIEFAPYVEAVAMKLVEVATSGEGIGAAIRNGVKSAVMAVATLADWFELLKFAFYGARTIILTGLAALVEGFNKLGSVIESVVNLTSIIKVKFNPMKEFAEGLRQEANSAAAQMYEALNRFNNGTNSKGAMEFLKALEDSANKAAKAIADAAAKQNELAKNKDILGGYLKGLAGGFVDSVSAGLTGLKTSKVGMFLKDFWQGEEAKKAGKALEKEELKTGQGILAGSAEALSLRDAFGMPTVEASPEAETPNAIRETADKYQPTQIELLRQILDAIKTSTTGGGDTVIFEGATF